MWAREPKERTPRREERGGCLPRRAQSAGVERVSKQRAYHSASTTCSTTSHHLYLQPLRTGLTNRRPTQKVGSGTSQSRNGSSHFSTSTIQRPGPERTRPFVFADAREKTRFACEKAGPASATK